MEKTNNITLKQLYELAYGEDEPFVSWKNPGYFVIANILTYMVRKDMEDCNDIGPIDIYVRMLNEYRLNVDDLEYCFDYVMTKKNTSSFDLLLYKANSKDNLFINTRKALEKLPDYLLNKIGLDKASYETGKPVRVLSYDDHDRFLSAVDFGHYVDVFKAENNMKEITANYAHLVLFREFFNNLNQCIQNNTDLTEFNEKWIKRFNLTIDKVKRLRKEVVDNILPDIAEQIQEYITSATPLVEDEDQDKELFDAAKINELENMVVGQQEATEKIKNRLLAANVGFKQAGQPIASFLLTGPTGVGKTETAKAIADACFDGKIYVVDMSTFKNSIDVSRLTGGSPNYVGYNDKNNFCDYVKENPKCVILFDELEKAHPDCTDVVMRILDEGQFINAKGETYSFENTVIICTTNLTQNKTTKRLGFTSVEETTEELVTGDTGFKKEIIGRFSEVIEYKMLEKDACKQIAKKFINATIKNFEKYNTRKIKLKYTDALIEHIAFKANTSLLGARDLKKTIQSEFINQVSSYIVANDCKDVTLTITPNGIKASKPKPKPTEKVKQVAVSEETTNGR